LNATIVPADLRRIVSAIVAMTVVDAELKGDEGMRFAGFTPFLLTAS
jgi:hypothetical protein